MDDQMYTDNPTQANGQGNNSQPLWLQDLIGAFSTQVSSLNAQISQLTQQVNTIDQRTQTQSPPQPTPSEQSTARTEAIPTPPSDVQRTPPSPPDPTELKRPKPRIKDLSTFTGKRSEWPAWKDEAIGKLSTDGTAIGSPMEQFSYLRACVGGSAARTILTYVQTVRQSGTGTPEGLLNYMEEIYGDANSEERANNRLNTMNQGKEAFATFLPKFERTLAEAGGVAWTDQVKINTLKRMLNLELRKSLVYIPTHPAAYPEFVRTLHTLASRLATLNPRSPTTTTTSNTSNSDTMDWESSVNNTQTPTTDDEQKRAQWVSKDTLEKRKSSNLCLRCGGRGHFISSCKLLPAKPPQQDQTKAKVANVKEDDDATVVEESGEGTESGKE